MHHVCETLLSFKDKDIQATLNIMRKDVELFQKYHMREDKLRKAFLGYTSRSGQSKSRDQVEQIEDKKGKRNHLKDQRRTIVKNFSFKGLVIQYVCLGVSLAAFSVFVILTSMGLTTTEKKFEMEKNFAKYQTAIYDVDDFMISTKLLISEGNYFKFAGRIPETLELSNSVDRLITFWNRLSPQFDELFEEKSLSVREMIFGDSCKHLTGIASISEIEYCRRWLKGAAVNGGILGFSLYMKETLQHHIFLLKERHSNFLRETTNLKGPSDLFFSVDLISVGIIYQQMMDLSRDPLEIVFVERVKEMTMADQRSLITLSSLMAVLGLGQLVLAYMAIVSLRRETVVVYETLRNIHPAVIMSNGAILGRLKMLLEASG